MIAFADLSRPGEGLITRLDDTGVSLTYVDQAGLVQTLYVGAGPEIRAALAGAPYVRVGVAPDGRMRLPTAVVIQVDLGTAAP